MTPTEKALRNLVEAARKAAGMEFPYFLEEVLAALPVSAPDPGEVEELAVWLAQVIYPETALPGGPLLALSERTKAHYTKLARALLLRLRGVWTDAR